jgi:hypothetical protein
MTVIKIINEFYVAKIYFVKATGSCENLKNLD